MDVGLFDENLSFLKMFKEDMVLWIYIFYYFIGCIERDEIILDCFLLKNKLLKYMK